MGYLLIIYHSVMNTSIIYCAVVFFCDLANVPSRKPFVLLVHFFQMSHTSSSSCLSSLGFGTPVETSVPSRGNHMMHTFSSGCDMMNDHIAHTVCVTYCGVYQTH